jgi:hypothetical protein
MIGHISYFCPTTSKLVAVSVDRVRVKTMTYQTGIGEYDNAVPYIQCDCGANHSLDTDFNDPL